MAARANDLRWTGGPGHYEVYYLTLTDRTTGVGVWIRYTMLAPLASATGEPSCSLWFAVMDPRPGALGTVARRTTLPIGQLKSGTDPFVLRLGESTLSDSAMTGGFDEFWWDLRWNPAPHAHVPINPLLGRLGLAKTVLVLPHADVLVSGSLGIGSERIDLSEVPAGQAHLWGSEHAESWAWAHCSDLSTPDGKPAPGAFFDGVSALVSRFGRTLGPNTPIVGCLGGRAFQSTSPRRILANSSRFDVGGWDLEAVGGSTKLIAHVKPTPEQLVGVTYHDPDGREAYCYNSETASVQLEVLERAGREWRVSQRLASAGRCHFEFGTRTPVPGIELQVR
jgi:hypothetical protein